MVDQIFNHLQSALNSNESFEMNDTFRLEVTTVAPRVLRGTGKPRRKKLGYLGAEDFLLKNKSVIKIRNPNDKLCGPRAIVAAKAAVDFPSGHGTRVQLTKAQSKSSDRPQLQAAYRLSKLAGVPEDCPVGPDELKKFQAVLPEYRIICVYVRRNSEAVAFAPYDEKKKDIIIIHHDDHYHGCNTLNEYYQTSYYCPYCLKGYNDKGHHRCQALENKLCKCCRRRDCPDFETCHPQHLKATLLCEPCGRYFFGPTCLANHLQYRVAGVFSPHQSVCKTVRHCKSCGKLNNGLNEQKKHQCGFSTCPTCKAYANLRVHRCYIESAREVKRKKEELEKAAKRRAEAEEEGPEPQDIVEELFEADDRMSEDQQDQQDQQDKKKPPLHVYFDLEARQDTGTHIANLCVYQTDEGYERIISGEDCVKTFIEDLKEFTEEDTRKVIVIAHNLQAYDGYFVIQEPYRDDKTVQQIRCGAKILELCHYGIRFIDSLNFFASPLSDFPKTFGLKLYAKDAAGRFIKDDQGNFVEHPLAKGYFPHLFNRVENQQYIGPLPPKEDYMPQTMSKEKKKDFDKWYQAEVDRNAIFNFQHELVEYCRLDVTILRLGCQTFQELFLKESNFNPFEHGRKRRSRSC